MLYWPNNQTEFGAFKVSTQVLTTKSLDKCFQVDTTVICSTNLLNVAAEAGWVSLITLILNLPTLESKTSYRLH